MNPHSHSHPDFGTAPKKLSIYLIGFICCILLTLLSFWVVMIGTLSKGLTFTVIYSSACIQFLVQVICFLRLNTQTEQSRTNVMSFIFTIVILIAIIIGSLWIMRNVNANLMI